MSASSIPRKALAIFTKFRSRRIFFYPFVILLFYFVYHVQVQSIQQHQISTTTTVPQRRKRILFWTKYFGIDNFHVGFGQKPFQHCPVSNCETTKRRNLLSASDAVMFHPMDLWSKDLPRSRSPDQRWIFFLLESPQAWGLKMKKPLADQFNWTMTYRTDSDIVRMYNEGMEKNWPIYEDQNSIREKLSKKSRAVAWFVSHCRTASKREHYANQLKKYIDVDVFGRCGPLKCGNSRRRNGCFSILNKNYKFYLSFENSICRDYVTEKFYNALSNYVVPLVNGAVDYSQFAPPGSYIHVRDFKSPKHLADYLKYLDSNQTAYEQYFEWRKYYIPKPHRSWCKLCEMLHNSSLRRQSYKDVYKWWKKGNCGGNREPMRTSRPEKSFTWHKRL